MASTGNCNLGGACKLVINSIAEKPETAMATIRKQFRFSSTFVLAHVQRSVHNAIADWLKIPLASNQNRFDSLATWHPVTNFLGPYLAAKAGYQTADVNQLPGVSLVCVIKHGTRGFRETGLAAWTNYASRGCTSFRTLRPRRILCEILAGRAGKWNTVRYIVRTP